MQFLTMMNILCTNIQFHKLHGKNYLQFRMVTKNNLVIGW